MPQVSDELVTDRPIEAVFDFTTTAGYWPRWHPTARRVAGEVDRPAQLGDRIGEQVTVAGVDNTVTWTIVGCDRPHRLELTTNVDAGRVRIGYDLAVLADGRTRFRRTVDFPELGPAFAEAMRAQSVEGLANLARLLTEGAADPAADPVE
ncbi:Polyketide cyclase / dehydrase and lipid transport [Frankia torreyi]|uniref:Polyketide cyclase / dehydrase and lipid transport n=1 Tax=Frankia torreyi TaxID=1856 RepID=A0A0D8BGJ4_9ACTN|nr:MULTISPECIES: SRPBCC family protein [Frankia]KJE23383.1 Polyketide cyclase / dehydrase and lipid transport [Frankia torreyi]KQM05422.1 Polyketide cyclase / dehydrase and lipid transport [Frankia sp. CpI1-P]